MMLRFLGQVIGANVVVMLCSYAVLMPSAAAIESGIWLGAVVAGAWIVVGMPVLWMHSYRWLGGKRE